MATQLSTDAGVHQHLFINSWHFLLIAVLAIVACRSLPGRHVRAVLLTIFNCYFLSFFISGWQPLALLAALIGLTYLIGEARVRYGERLPEAVFTGIVILMWIALFFVKDPNLLSVANPFHYFPVRIIGISYLMFRAIGYVSDVEILPRRSLLTFFNYMVFFPTLLVGPIERFDRFQREHDAEHHERKPVKVLPTLHRIANGLIKKFILADNLAAFGILGQGDLGEVAVPLLWIGVLLQLLVLYLDFSGYCDIVLGVAALMGIPVMENFNHPFRATSIQDFWNRWHISLTSFLRDYVFTPLNYVVVSRFDRRWHFALITGVYFFTMMLIALWHDTTWGFFAFGVVHGAALVLLQIYRHFVHDRMQASTQQMLQQSAAVQYAARTFTYVFVSMSMTLWSFGVNGSWQILRSMMGL